MATTIALLVGAHALALAGVLAMARRDHVLVDDAGRPLQPGWREHLVPAQEPAAEPVRR